MQGNLFGEAAITLPWARKEEQGFASLETVDQFTVAIEETKVFTPSFVPLDVQPLETPDVPDNAEMEEGLSRPKLAIKALDDQFRSSSVFTHELPLAEAS